MKSIKNNIAMTAKEFVKSKVPKAKAEKQVSGYIKGLQQVYWLIRERGQYMYIAEGKSQNEAWTNAKKKILEQEK
jgi:hypothetical protein